VTWTHQGRWQQMQIGAQILKHLKLLEVTVLAFPWQFYRYLMNEVSAFECLFSGSKPLLIFIYCFPYIIVWKSECQQLICEILRATPEAASADASLQTARLASKVPSKGKKWVTLILTVFLASLWYIFFWVYKGVFFRSLSTSQKSSFFVISSFLFFSFLVLVSCNRVSFSLNEIFFFSFLFFNI
jgi:hypothetical protein